MKKFIKKNLLIILISLLFLVTRIYKISSIPSSVYWDEASIGYNAYSVLKTGKDEWGSFLPLHFRAFGEFKLPVYIYSVLLSESIFGLTPLAVRLPAVFYGLLSLIGLYLLVLIITKNKTITLFSSFLFSISPWFFIFSRTGYEATAGLTFFIWGIYLFFKYKNQNWKIMFSIFSLILAIYSYNSFRILAVPLLGLVLGFIFLKGKKSILIVSSVLLILATLPIYKLYTKDSGLVRLQTVKSTDYIINYFENFSPEFLFIKGDTNPRSQMPGQSQLYVLDLPFLVLGFLYIYKKTKKKNFWYLIFPALLLIAPLPAAITKENPHALRSILMVPSFVVISAFGIYYLVDKLKKNKIIVYTGVTAIYGILFLNYLANFLIGYNKQTLSDWQYEYKQVFTTQKEGCVNDQFGQPYIFALFYQKIDPNYFRETKVLNPVSDWGFSTVKSFGNFVFEKSCL